MTTIEDAKAILDLASSKVASANRLSKKERMEILSLVYSIDLSHQDRANFHEYIATHRKIEGANRAYVESKTNEFALPLRYIFPSIEDRSTVSRYSGALSVLRRDGVPPNEFHKEVKRRGGLVDLYWQSRQTDRTQKRQRISLSRPLDFTVGKLITLTLRPNEHFLFEVIDDGN